jgi:teichoic acid transport system ATP-binding protein
MAAKTKKVASNEGRKPVVVVDNAHVIYKVFGTGRKVTGNMAKGGLFTKKIRVREVHAVKGVSFTIYEGESVGIIGSNGSGKSSLMRAVAGLTPLAEGAVYAFARPSLLGVGAVLLPALSGERNIILGGLAMGFSKKDIQEKADDITKFAGIEEFIDLPMRTYSSGMSARLRFAIAAARNHDILIIDEALAVGDQEFRAKSEARMREMRDQAGTVFLVSHSMKSILDTCNRVIWIEKGVLKMDGDPETVTNAYNDYIGSTTID